MNCTIDEQETTSMKMSGLLALLSTKPVRRWVIYQYMLSKMFINTVLGLNKNMEWLRRILHSNRSDRNVYVKDQQNDATEALLDILQLSNFKQAFKYSVEMVEQRKCMECEATESITTLETTLNLIPDITTIKCVQDMYDTQLGRPSIEERNAIECNSNNCRNARQRKQYVTKLNKANDVIFVMIKKQFIMERNGSVRSTKSFPSTSLRVLSKNYQLKALVEHCNSSGPNSGHYKYWHYEPANELWMCRNDNLPVERSKAAPRDGIMFLYELKGSQTTGDQAAMPIQDNLEQDIQNLSLTEEFELHL